MPVPKDPIQGDESNESLSEIVDARHADPARVVLDPSSPSVRSIVRVTIVALLLIFVGSYLESIVNSLTKLFFLIILSVFFAYLIDPLVKLIRRPFKARNAERFMPRTLAIAISYLTVFIVLGLAIAYIAPRAATQAKEFVDNVPTFVTNVRERVYDLNRRFDRLRLPDQLEMRINEKVTEGIDALATFFASVVFGSYLLNILAYSPWLVLVPVLSFFFLKDVNLFRLGALRLVPAGKLRIRTESILQDINTTLAAYVRAQLISCVLIGSVCTVAFYLIGLKYALLLGIMAGIFEFIPLLGPLVIGVIATTTAALGEDPQRAFYVAVFLIVFRIIHDYVTYPRIIRDGIHLHPVMIIISVLAGEQIAGIPGVFLAIPVVALLTVAYKHFLEYHGGRTLFEGLVHPQSPLSEDAD